MLQKQSSKIRPGKFVPYLFAAAISLIIGIILFKIKEVAPFGDNSVLCMDLWGQYFPMYLNNKLADGLSGMLHSWNGAFGFNNWVQSAYYCNSIFVFLLRFVSVGKMVTALDIFCLVKMSLSAVTCLLFFRRKFQSNSPLLIAGAVSYSTCAYMLAFISQFMWTDALFLAPLVLLGIDRLIYQKKPVFYAVVLGISIFCSFYIGFAMCIFSVVYFLCEALPMLSISWKGADTTLHGAKAFREAVLRFLGFSVLAGLLSACAIIPVGLGISQTIASEANAPTSLVWYNNIFAVLQNLLSGRQNFVEYQGQNIFVGIMIFLAIPLYFLNRKIKPVKKFFNGLAFLFLLASMNSNILDYIWHGFHFPNQLPGRWTFMFSLFAMMLAVEGLIKVKEQSPRDTFLGTLIGLGLVYVCRWGLGETAAFDLPRYAWFFLFGAAILLNAISILFSMTGKVSTDSEDEAEITRVNTVNKNRQLIRRIAALCYALILGAFMVIDSGKHFATVGKYEGTRGMLVAQESSYSKTIDKHVQYGQKWRSGSDTFYRVEANSGYTFNPSMIGDYHGIRYYSSTMSGSVFRFLKFLGNRVYADKVSSVYSISSPVQNSLFGIKYFMDFDRSLNNLLPNMQMIEEGENGNFFENPTALSIAYPVSNDAIAYEVGEEIRGIKNQNNLVNKLCGEEINPYVYVPCLDLVTEHATLQHSEDWNQNMYITDPGEPSVTFHYTYTIDKAGSYFFEHNFRAGKIQISNPSFQRTYNYGDNNFFFAGKLNEGDTLHIDVTAENISVGCFGLDLYRLDTDNWTKAYNKLSAHQLNVTHATDSRIEGDINLDENSLVLATIAQDGGWKVYCDGKKVETTKIADTLLAARIPAGSHKIVMKYHVPGLAIGMTLTLLSAAILILYINKAKVMRLLNKYRKPKPAAAGADNTPYTIGNAPLTSAEQPVEEEVLPQEIPAEPTIPDDTTTNI